MSRNDGKVGSDGAAQIDAAQILAEMDASREEHRRRQEAIARCLSGSDGWKEALAILGGAFASAETDKVNRE